MTSPEVVLPIATNNPVTSRQLFRLRLGVYKQMLVLSASVATSLFVLLGGSSNEGTPFGKEDVRQMQSHSSSWQGLRDLREPSPQAASGLREELEVGTY